LLLNFTGCSCFYDLDYQGFQKVVIPTDSELRGTIYIPEEWKFITEDGIIKLINGTTNEVYAEQIVQGVMDFSGLSAKDCLDNIFPNTDNLLFNTNIGYDIGNGEKYEHISINSNSTEQLKFTENDQSFNVCRFLIYHNHTSAKDSADYYLMLFFYPNIEESTLQRIMYSYKFGGFLQHDDE
jgi:hypothetical protein